MLICMKISLNDHRYLRLFVQPEASMFIAFVIFGLFIAAPAEQARAVPMTDDQVLFHSGAGGPCKGIKLALLGAAVEDSDKQELAALLDGHLAAVAVAARQMVGGQMSYNEVEEKAAKLADDFNEKTLNPWLVKHPEASLAIGNEFRVAEIVFLIVSTEPQKLVKMARAAGVPAAKEVEARGICEAAKEQLIAYDNEMQVRQQPIMALPDGDQKQKQLMVVTAQGQAETARVRFDVLSRLRALVPPAAWRNLDAAILVGAEELDRKRAGEGR